MKTCEEQLLVKTNFDLNLQAVLRMRLRISYVVDGNSVLEPVEVSGFPEDAFD